jgi:DNA-binding response OmpR family regulator
MPESLADTPRRLLLVEDDRATITALRALLARRGWQIEVAESVQAAMELLKQLPDAMILDVMLPDGDGGQVLHFVRESRLPVRVAVTTGMSDPVRLAEIRGLRPDCLLKKPIDLAELFRCLSHVA